MRSLIAAWMAADNEDDDDVVDDDGDASALISFQKIN